MPNSPPFRNRLLAALSPADQRRIRPHLKPMVLELRRVLERPDSRIDRVYFLESGIASVVAEATRNRETEVGLIGFEGMTGLTVVLGDHRSPNAVYMQAAGSGYEMRVAALRRAMDASATLRPLLLKFVQAFMTQTAQTAVANARAKIDDRLARWLLMAHDRMRNAELPLTHEFLALMLGVRRAGVSEAVAALESEGLVRGSRGLIVVLDRRGLERRALGFYGVAEAEYRRLLER